MSPGFGEFPVADVCTLGDQISSTGEGRHIAVLESDLNHPTHGDGMADNGDTVFFGMDATGDNNGVGVVVGKSAAVAGDRVVIDTEGIWCVDVSANSDAGGVAVEGGEQLYISRAAPAVVSKISNVALNVPFGMALGHIDAGLTETIAVKVHKDPPWIGGPGRMYKTVTTGSYGLNLRTTLAGGASEGVGGYIEAHLTAAQTGGLYGFGSWINVDSAGLLDGSIITPFEGGIYVSGAEAAARVVFMAQGMYVGGVGIGAPASLHAWRLNVAAAAGNVTALIQAASVQAVGYNGGTTGDGVIGTIPFVEMAGIGMGHIEVHATVS